MPKWKHNWEEVQWLFRGVEALPNPVFNLCPREDLKMDAVRRQYKRRVEQDVNSAGLSINRPNRVSYYQSLFQVCVVRKLCLFRVHVNTF